MAEMLEARDQLVSKGSDELPERDPWETVSCTMIGWKLVRMD
jgi:hypothetical protein